MKLSASRVASSHQSPLSTVEDLFIERDWMYERRGDEEIAAQVPGRWCDYRTYMTWRPEMDSFMINMAMDLRVPKEHTASVFELLSAMNARLWMGHFELALDDQLPTYRHTIPLRGGASLSSSQIEQVITTAIEESDRFYPAFQFVMWGGKDAQDAALAVMLDTVGEA